MSGVLTGVFVTGVVVHTLAAVVFAYLAYAYVSDTRVRGTQSFEQRKAAVAFSALIVVLITATVYGLQIDGFGRFPRSDGQAPFLTEWIGYSVSLALIAKSLLLTYMVPFEEQFPLLWTLFAVGLGGVLGVFIPSSFPAAQAVLVIGVSVIYIAFVVFGIRYSRVYTRTQEYPWLFVYFVAATIPTYILFYSVGPTIGNVVSEEVEHLFYLLGNIASKIVLPILEVQTITAQQPPRAPGQAPPRRL